MANVNVPPFTEAPDTVVGSTPQSVFPFEFPFWSNDDILVYVDGELVDADDYSVEGFYIQGDPPAAVEGGYGSGEVTLDSAVSNVTVTIDRMVVGDRETQFSRSSPLGMPALNGDLNRLTARQQDLKRLIGTNRAYLDAAVAEAGDAIGLIGKADKDANLSDMADAATALANIGGAANDKLPLLVDDYYEEADGSDDGPSFTRAFAAALTAHRDIRCTPAKIYSISTTIPILPDADGWTPGLFGNDAHLDIAAAAGGFRYRGIKSGQSVNPATGFIRDLTIDANLLVGSSGIYGIFVENGGALIFENVHGVNYIRGYHIINFRYADGGDPVGGVTVRNCRVTGATLADSSDSNKWYGFSDTGDLSVVMPGDSVAAGDTVVIATVNTGLTSYGAPNVSTAYFWTNGTGSPIAVPATLTAAAMSAAGLTQGGTTATLNGATTVATLYEYYSSGGTRKATAVVKAALGLIDGLSVNGGYYGAYLSGTDRYRVRNYLSENAIRGFACEWGASGVAVDDITVLESFSSAILFGYNCENCSVDSFKIEELTSRWEGEALINVQLSCPDFTLGRGTIHTRTTVTDGQYMIKGSVDCSNFTINGPVFIKGDCLKAYICIESAYNSAITAANPEHYPTSTFYNGGASVDMTGIRLRNIEIVADTTKATSAGATALCLMQVEDTVNGNIGLSDIVIENVRAASTKHVRPLKFYEGSTAAKQINNVTMTNVIVAPQSNPATAAVRMILPRRWAHFTWLKNVTNMDDALERTIPDVATPDLTFGTHWVASGSTNIDGILGGQGATSSEGYDNRMIYIRGGGTRSLTTVSGSSGTKDGIRLQTSPVTLTTTQKRSLVYNRNTVSWIEV